MTQFGLFHFTLKAHRLLQDSGSQCLCYNNTQLEEEEEQFSFIIYDSFTFSKVPSGQSMNTKL